MATNAPQQQQNRPQGTTATADVPDPYTDPAAYLRSKGWKCLGDPSWPTAEWLDPEAPRRDSYSKKKVEYQVQVDDVITHRDGRKEVKTRTETKRVMAQDGRGTYQEAEQVVYHPAVQGVPMTHALRIQTDRDLRAEEARQKSA